MLTKASADSQTGVLDGHRIAVLLPCHNEEAAVAEVVDAFRAALPAATIYVYDNNSTDRTIDMAQAAGAVVRTERHQGKGYVVRRMFADIDADIYVLADGDATYDAPSAPAMIARLIEEKLDMVVGARVHREEAAYRRGHQTGNRLLTGFVDQHLRTVVQRHAVGLPGVLAALRKVVSGPLRRFRDRDRTDHPRART